MFEPDNCEYVKIGGKEFLVDSEFADSIVGETVERVEDHDRGTNPENEILDLT